jgi:hypothetical protein
MPFPISTGCLDRARGCSASKNGIKKAARGLDSRPPRIYVAHRNNEATNGKEDRGQTEGRREEGVTEEVDEVRQPQERGRKITEEGRAGQATRSQGAGLAMDGRADGRGDS